MKATEPWTCPCCYGQNAATVDFCPCGESHRDERVVQVFEKPIEQGGDWFTALAFFAVGVIGTLALAYWLTRM